MSVVSICVICGVEFAQTRKRLRDPDRKTCSRSCAVKLAWSDPEKASTRKKSIRESFTAERKAALSEQNVARWARPGEREKLSEGNRKRWADPEFKKRTSASIATAQRTPENRKRYSDIRRAAWQRPDYRAKNIASNKLSHSTPEAKARTSAQMKMLWVTHRATMLKNLITIASRRKRIVEVKELVYTEKERQALRSRRFVVKKLAKRFAPVSAKELSRLAAESQVLIKRLPMGASVDWKPTWMND